MTHYKWWSTCESHLLYTHVTWGAAHMHVLLKWIIICTRMLLTCTRMLLTFTYGMYIHKINVHTFYKTLNMYLNEYNLAWQSLRRIVLHNKPFLHIALTHQIIINFRLLWLSIYGNRVLYHVRSNKFHFFVSKEKLSWHLWVDSINRQVSDMSFSLWAGLQESTM